MLVNLGRLKFYLVIIIEVDVIKEKEIITSKPIIKFQT